MLQFPASAISSSIPNLLVNCYRGNGSQPFFPQTLSVLIELIQKIEHVYADSMDLRMLSTSLLHSLRVDGIERDPNTRETDFVTPYGMHGLMHPKYQLLLSMISKSSSNFDVRRALTETEMCQLHRMISSGVEPWERGDENRICPMSYRDMDFSSADHRKHFNQNHHHTLRTHYVHRIRPFE